MQVDFQIKSVSNQAQFYFDINQSRDNNSVLKIAFKLCNIYLALLVWREDRQGGRRSDGCNERGQF